MANQQITTMKSKLADKKRKSRESDAASEDGLANGIFNGVLSQSEDEFDDVVPEDDDNDEGGGSGEDESGSDSSGDKIEDIDDLISDDIPSEADEEAAGKLKDGEELEIEEPGVDPKRKDKDDEERNYRVEKDANGNDRYVYKCVHQRREGIFGPNQALTGRVQQ